MPRASRSRQSKAAVDAEPIDEAAQLRRRLFSSDPDVPLPELLDKALRCVRSSVEPALRGKGSSAIILLSGPRGCGKTAVVNRLLHELRVETWATPPTVVALHGLCHANATASFRSVARALGGDGTGGAQMCLGEIGARITALRDQKAPILFVLDDFHRFAGDQQTVLYAIFNLLQDASLRAAAVCLTPHIDVADRLEKRVKSRFSAKEVMVELPTSVDDVLSFLSSALQDEPRAAAFLSHKTTLRVIERQFCCTRALGPVCDAVDAALLSCDGDVETAVRGFQTALERCGTAGDSIWGLSTLELALLLATLRIERRSAAAAGAGAARDILMFDDVYKEYEGLATGGQATIVRTQMAHIEPRAIAEKAWERVVEGGLVARAGSGTRRVVALAVAPDVVLDALKDHPSATTLLQRWGSGAAVV